MKSPSALNKANLVTLLRICLIPIFFIFFLQTFWMDIWRAVGAWTGKLCLLCQDRTILSILTNAPGNLNRWILWPLTTVLTAVTFFGYALEAL